MTTWLQSSEKQKQKLGQKEQKPATILSQQKSSVLNFKSVLSENLWQLVVIGYRKTNKKLIQSNTYRGKGEYYIK